jgi:protein-S-isoprenylcysteine O-methyltransferase Ste14
MPLSSTGRERLPPNEIKALSHISRLFNFIFIRNKHVVLDIIERVFLLILYGRFAVRMILSLDASPNLATLLLIVSEGLPIIIIAVRGWSNTISDKPFDWVLAFMGASVPLLSAPGNASAVIPQQFAVLIMLTGTFVQISAKVILWRSFGIVPANRGLKIAGPYRFIRHPMYAGYTIAHIGFLLAVPSLWNTIIYSLALALQIARLLREERLLSCDPGYQEYSARVRFRLCPGVF